MSCLSRCHYSREPTFKRFHCICMCVCVYVYLCVCVCVRVRDYRPYLGLVRIWGHYQSKSRCLDTSKNQHPAGCSLEHKRRRSRCLDSVQWTML